MRDTATSLQTVLHYFSGISIVLVLLTHLAAPFLAAVTFILHGASKTYPEGAPEHEISVYLGLVVHSALRGEIGLLFISLLYLSIPLLVVVLLFALITLALCLPFIVVNVVGSDDSEIPDSGETTAGYERAKYTGVVGSILFPVWWFGSSQLGSVETAETVRTIVSRVVGPDLLLEEPIELIPGFSLLFAIAAILSITLFVIGFTGASPSEGGNQQ